MNADLDLYEGDTFNNQNGPYKYKCHVVKTIIDGDYKIILYKYFGKHKQWWHYDTMVGLKMGGEI